MAGEVTSYGEHATAPRGGFTYHVLPVRSGGREGLVLAEESDGARRTSTVWRKVTELVGRLEARTVGTGSKSEMTAVVLVPDDAAADAVQLRRREATALDAEPELAELRRATRAGDRYARVEQLPGRPDRGHTGRAATCTSRSAAYGQPRARSTTVGVAGAGGRLGTIVNRSRSDHATARKST